MPFDAATDCCIELALNSHPILDVRGLGKSYTGVNGTLTVLKDISLTLASGSSCAIVGPSGSGKTTLIGLCAGLDLPTEGEVYLDGAALGRLDEDGRARLRSEKVGFVFQTFQLIPTLTALENVMVPLELRRESSVRERASVLLDRVGLGERMGHYPAQLSGGEQQRVALARAFVSQPKILFADEPTGNLDADTGRLVIERLFALNAEAGTALVLVTHDPELAGRAQKVVRLKGGMRVHEDGV
jgi:putative ABC transport system ATP-binding protein